MGGSLASTITRTAASEVKWDTIVVGAGIAGSLTSLGLARLGRKVLLIERSAIPRDKVCGACLNQGAIRGLEFAGVWPKIAALGGIPLSRYYLRAGRSAVNLELSGGHAVSRSAMDRTLVESAIAEGVHVLTETPVTIDSSSERETRRFVIDNHGHHYDAKVVIGATGLGGKSLTDVTEQEIVVSRDSRIGLGARWVAGHDHDGSAIRLDAGAIYMAAGRHGYVGMVMTEGGVINLAAAVDRAAVQSLGPAGVCDELLRSCGWDLGMQLRQTSFRGTQTLTRKRAVAGGHRLFFVGDACGYVEPFTGEGMEWAIRSSIAAVPHIDEAIETWSPELPLRWTKELHRMVGKQQRRCRLLSKALRHPALIRQAVRVFSRFPTLGQIAVEHFQGERSHALPDHGAGYGSAWPSCDAA